MNLAEDFEMGVYDGDYETYESDYSDACKETWECKDGRILKIKDMDSLHLKNAVQMLRRKEKEIPIIMERELESRSDI